LSNRNQVLGKWGEVQAAEYLKNKGYRIVEKNYRSEYGEIDLIVRQDNLLVFAEVKARSSEKYGFPEEAVTIKKQARILATAQHYLLTIADFNGDWRIDVLALVRTKDEETKFRHFENAFS
jgi:putative endonuclease